METVKYKTNINCDGCIKSVTPHLNQVDNLESWKVNTENPSKILEVLLDSEDDSDVLKAVKEAGFEIERL